MPDTSHLSQAQKMAVRPLLGWEMFSAHPNGDITIKVGDEMHRFDLMGNEISMAGHEIIKQGNFMPPLKPRQASLSDELTAAVKVTPIKTEKKEYKPAYQSVCQEKPECCAPREIKAAYWDADHTIWDMPGTAASVTGKLKKVDDNTVIELSSSSIYEPYYETTGYQLSETEEKLMLGLSEGEQDFLLKELEKEHGSVIRPKSKEAKKTGEYIRTTIRLDPTFRKTLDELEKRGIHSSIISLNTPGSVKRILKEFGLDTRFKEIRDSYENKGSVFKELNHKFGVCPCNAIFIDDNLSNIDAVADKCGMALQIGKGKDIQSDLEVLKYIK
jgi:FMN phosphatase YigB (HAD superfamily)